MRSYLVTGGLGFLGAPLVRRLLKEGYRVRVMDNLSRGSLDRLGEARNDVEVITASVRDAGAVQNAVHGVDSVCHLAFVNGTENFYKRPAHVLDVGVRGIVNVMDACMKSNVDELILASSSEVYQTPPSIPTDESVPLSIPDPFNPRYSYAGGKIISELMAIHYGREYFERVLIFRPHNVYGPDMGWDHVIPQLIARLLRLNATSRDEVIPLPIQGTGNQSRAFIFIDDCIAGIMAVLAKGEHLNIYNVGTSKEITIREVADRIADLVGVRIRIISGPEAPGGTTRRCPDIRKLENLGFRTRVSFDEGLRRTIEWYGAHMPPGLDVEVPITRFDP
jgi:nucleoside-diphosphate-sugar epimerase